MSRNTPTLDRRSYLRATGAAALGTTALAGCVGTATGTLATRVTDQPGDIGDFESLIVTVEGIWLGPQGAGDESDDDSDDETDEESTAEEDTDGESTATATEDGEDDADDEDDSSGREYHEFDEPQEADLVQLQNGETQLVGEHELEVAEYAFLQLDVADEIDATLADDGDATVETPGEAPLTFNQSFEVRENTRTTFTADFTPVKRGQTGTYILQPVPEGIEVTYEETDGGTEAEA